MSGSSNPLPPQNNVVFGKSTLAPCIITKEPVSDAPVVRKSALNIVRKLVVDKKQDSSSSVPNRHNNFDAINSIPSSVAANIGFGRPDAAGKKYYSPSQENIKQASIKKGVTAAQLSALASINVWLTTSPAVSPKNSGDNAELNKLDFDSPKAGVEPQKDADKSKSLIMPTNTSNAGAAPTKEAQSIAAAINTLLVTSPVSSPRDSKDNANLVVGIPKANDGIQKAAAKSSTKPINISQTDAVPKKPAYYAFDFNPKDQKAKSGPNQIFTSFNRFGSKAQ